MRSWFWMSLAIALSASCGADDDKGTQCDCTDTSQKNTLCRCPPHNLDASTDASKQSMDAQSVLDAKGDACLPPPCPWGSPWNADTCRCETDAGQACSGPGNYERGKGDTTPNCCPGLQQIEMGVPSYGADDTMTCGHPTLAVFMCIEGTCGDGRCEQPEAAHCGCLADCPSAAFGSWDGGATF